MSILHPERPNFYDIAAHDYVGDNNFAVGQLDYEYYDAGTFAMAYGFCEDEGFIKALDGVDAVSTMDEFLFWSVETHVGDYVRATRDLRGTPFIANLRHHGDRERSLELADHVRDSIVWEIAAGPTETFRAQRANLGPRIANKAAWMAYSAANQARSKMGG